MKHAFHLCMTERAATPNGPKRSTSSYMSAASRNPAHGIRQDPRELRCCRGLACLLFHWQDVRCPTLRSRLCWWIAKLKGGWGPCRRYCACVSPNLHGGFYCQSKIAWSKTAFDVASATSAWTDNDRWSKEKLAAHFDEHNALVWKAVPEERLLVYKPEHRLLGMNVIFETSALAPSKLLQSTLILTTSRILGRWESIWPRVSTHITRVVRTQARIPAMFTSSLRKRPMWKQLGHHLASSSIWKFAGKSLTSSLLAILMLP